METRVHAGYDDGLRIVDPGQWDRSFVRDHLREAAQLGDPGGAQRVCTADLGPEVGMAAPDPQVGAHADAGVLGAVVQPRLHHLDAGPAGQRDQPRGRAGVQQHVGVDDQLDRSAGLRQRPVERGGLAGLRLAQHAHPRGVARADRLGAVVAAVARHHDLDGRVERDERVLVTTLTKRMAEDLTEYLDEAGVDVEYMHDETDTLERHELIRSLRLGEIDVLVGINLLREGLDIPEVSLVAILDADQEGFLRSETTLVQTMGRAARNVNGEVVLYADDPSNAMESAIEETNRRREIQEEYNEEHGFEPTTIEKEVGESSLPGSKTDTGGASSLDPEDDEEAARAIERLEERMQEAADNLEFELAADIRDRIHQLREEYEMGEDEDGVVPEPVEEF